MGREGILNREEYSEDCLGCQRMLELLLSDKGLFDCRWRPAGGSGFCKAKPRWDRHGHSWSSVKGYAFQVKSTRRDNVLAVVAFSAFVVAALAFVVLFYLARHP